MLAPRRAEPTVQGKKEKKDEDLTSSPNIILKYVGIQFR
jgi:hypothetical protein